MEFQEKIKSLIQQMTLAEKASLCSGKDFWYLKGIERLGIPSIMVTDGPHGLRKQAGKADHVGLNESVPATCFPTASTLAATWNRDLVYQVGQALGEECRQEKSWRDPGAGRQYQALSPVRTQLRVFLRGPLPDRRDRQKLHQWRAKPGYWYLIEALRGQQPGIPRDQAEKGGAVVVYV